MRDSIILLVVANALLTSTLAAQTPAPSAAPAVAACPPSVTVKQLITALDMAFSGPKDRDRGCFRALFLSDAHLVQMMNGTDNPRILTVDGYIEEAHKRKIDKIYERQIQVRSESWGGIAQLWSTYEIRPEVDAAPLGRGIMSIQAVFDGRHWRVLEVLDQSETPLTSIPTKYLP